MRLQGKGREGRFEMTDKELKNYTYEEAISAIEAILGKMDMGEVPLSESMKNFEDGMKLIAHCEGILSSYESRITKIIGIKDGEPVEEEFNG